MTTVADSLMEDDREQCPFCGEMIDWNDALRFGCPECGATFYEEEEPYVVVEFIPEGILGMGSEKGRTRWM